LFAEQHRFRLGRIHDHNHQSVQLTHGRQDVNGRTAVSSQPFDRRRIDIGAINGVTRAEQRCGYAVAHGAKTDDADIHEAVHSIVVAFLLKDRLFDRCAGRQNRRADA
jgi:hypothetical protein